jgi:hypothetical protein
MGITKAIKRVVAQNINAKNAFSPESLLEEAPREVVLVEA